MNMLECTWFHRASSRLLLISHEGRRTNLVLWEIMPVPSPLHFPQEWDVVHQIAIGGLRSAGYGILIKAVRLDLISQKGMKDLAFRYEHLICTLFCSMEKKLCEVTISYCEHNALWTQRIVNIFYLNTFEFEFCFSSYLCQLWQWKTSVMWIYCIINASYCEHNTLWTHFIWTLSYSMENLCEVNLFFCEHILLWTQHIVNTFYLNTFLLNGKPLWR